MISKPLSQIIEIPDASLNEKLIPANDNHETTAFSRENLEAGSILAPRHPFEASITSLAITMVFCLFFVIVVSGLWVLFA
jgi:hypothetical protein